MSPRKREQPKRPADLSGTSVEMKLVEMACLSGLSSSAGKSAGRIMHEEVRAYRSCFCSVVSGVVSSTKLFVVSFRVFQSGS